MAVGSGGTWADIPVLGHHDGGKPILNGTGGQNAGEHVEVSLWISQNNSFDEQIGDTSSGAGTITATGPYYTSAAFYTYVKASGGGECYSEHLNI